MLSTILLSLGVPAVIALAMNWNALFWGAFQVCNRYLGRSATRVVPLAMTCIAVYCIAPVFEYTLLLVWSYVLLELENRLTEHLFRVPSIVFFCFVSYVQFWNFIGRDVFLTINLALVCLLREYRWKRFVVDCLYEDNFGFATKVVLYLGDWIHYVFVGDWKIIVLLEFHAKHYPGPQPPYYAQLRHRFLGELQVMIENRPNVNPEIGVAVEDILAIACGLRD